MAVGVSPVSMQRASFDTVRCMYVCMYVCVYLCACPPIHLSYLVCIYAHIFVPAAIFNYMTFEVLMAVHVVTGHHVRSVMCLSYSGR